MEHRNCDRYGVADFTALAAGDLSRPASWQMRRHLAECTSCRAEFAQVNALWHLAATNSAVALSPAVADRTWERLTAVAITGGVHARRQVFRVAALGATVAVAGIATFLLVVPGSPLRPAPAFARVEEAMEGVRTATWQQTHLEWVERRMRKGGEPDKHVYEHWVQLDPPRSATRLLSSNTEAHPWKSVSDGVYEISQEGDTGKEQERPIYFRTDADRQASDALTPRERIAQDLVFPRDAAAQGAKEYNETFPSGSGTYSVRRSAWESHPDQIDGARVLRFDSRQTLVYPPRPYTKNKESRREIGWRVWVDPTTYRIVRREVFSLPENSGRYYWRTISDHFQFNGTPPVSTFQIPRPSPGRWFEYNDFSHEGFRRQRTTPAEKQAMESVVHQVVDAWNRRDAAAFEQLWDFGDGARRNAVYSGSPLNPQKIAEQRRHWIARMRQGAPYQSWKVVHIQNLEMGYGGNLYRLRSASDPFPPTGSRPAYYAANIECLAVVKPGTAAVPCTTTITLARGEAGKPRVTYMNMYSRSLRRARPSGKVTRPAAHR